MLPFYDPPVTDTLEDIPKEKALKKEFFK